jgi:hypothetical protein
MGLPRPKSTRVNQVSDFRNQIGQQMTSLSVVNKALAGFMLQFSKEGHLFSDICNHSTGARIFGDLDDSRRKFKRACTSLSVGFFLHMKHLESPIKP